MSQKSYFGIFGSGYIVGDASYRQKKVDSDLKFSSEHTKALEICKGDQGRKYVHI